MFLKLFFIIIIIFKLVSCMNDKFYSIKKQLFCGDCENILLQENMQW